MNYAARPNERERRHAEWLDGFGLRFSRLRFIPVDERRHLPEASMTEQAIATFKQNLRGRVIQPGDTDYEAAREPKPLAIPEAGWYRASFSTECERELY